MIPRCLDKWLLGFGSIHGSRKYWQKMRLGKNLKFGLGNTVSCEECDIQVWPQKRDLGWGQTLVRHLLQLLTEAGRVNRWWGESWLCPIGISCFQMTDNVGVGLAFCSAHLYNGRIRPQIWNWIICWMSISNEPKLYPECISPMWDNWTGIHSSLIISGKFFFSNNWRHTVVLPPKLWSQGWVSWSHWLIEEPIHRTQSWLLFCITVFERLKSLNIFRKMGST